MTARIPRTMTAEREAKARKFSSNPELMFTWDIWAELDAERDVSRKLAEALEHFTASDLYDSDHTTELLHAVRRADAALAQYTANALASSKDPGNDTLPSQGGRD